MSSRYQSGTGRSAALAAGGLVSLSSLVAGLTLSTVLSDPTWPAPLRNQALVLMAIAVVASLILVAAFRQGWARRLLILYGSLAGGLLLAAFGIAGLSGALIVFLTSLMLGRGIVQLTGRGNLSLGESLVTGFGALLLILTGLAVTGLTLPPLMWGVAIVTVAWAARPSGYVAGQLAASLETLAAEPQFQARHVPWLMAVPITLFLFALMLFSAQAALPERYFDALTVHLLIPTQISTFGIWDVDPREYAFAMIPAAIDYAFAYAYVLGGEEAARAFNLGLFVCILAQIVAIVRPLYGTIIAGLSVLLMVSIPVALVVTASLFVENGYALLAIAGVRLAMRTNAEDHRATLVGVAVIAGALCSIKLFGVLFAGLIVIAALFAHGVKPLRLLHRADWQVITAFAVVAGALGVSQYLSSWYATGNPVFPFQNAFFRSPYWPPLNFADTRWMGRLSPMLLYNMTFSSDSFLEASPGALGFVFVALLVPAIIVAWIRPQRVVTVCLLVAAIYVAAVLMQIQYIRYLYPAFPLLIVVCSAALAHFSDMRGARGPVLAAATGLAALGIYKLPTGGWILQHTDLVAVFDETRRQALIRAQVPIRLVNQVLSDLHDKPTVIIAAETPYGSLLRGRPILAFWYNQEFVDALNVAAGPADIKTVIEARRPDYIVVDPQSVSYGHPKILAYAQANCDLVATVANLSIYRARR